MNHAIAIRQTIDQYLNQLSLERLNVVAEFLAYLADKESEDATQELLEIPHFLESFERGKKDIEEGRLVDWRTIRHIEFVYQSKQKPSMPQPIKLPLKKLPDVYNN